MNPKGQAIEARLPVSPAVKALNPEVFGTLPSEQLARQLYGDGKETGKRGMGDTGKGKAVLPGKTTGGYPLSTIHSPHPKPREHTLRLNPVERRMLARLEERLQRGEIAVVRAMGMRLRYALDKAGHYMTYTPDFVVTETDGRLTMIETKGKRAFNKAVSRFKACRADWPEFDFEMWQWADGAWTKIL